MYFFSRSCSFVTTISFKPPKNELPNVLSGVKNNKNWRNNYYFSLPFHIIVEQHGFNNVDISRSWFTCKCILFRFSEVFNINFTIFLK